MKISKGVVAVLLCGALTEASALCIDGSVSSCSIGGQSGIRECVAGHWGPCEVPELPQPQASYTMTFNVSTASIVSEYVVSLAANTPVTFRTTNLSIGSDPVLHLLDSTGKEVALAGGGGTGVAEVLTYIPTASGNHTLVVRARSNATAGTCNIMMNSAAWTSGVKFGGWQTSLTNLRANESLETVKVPNGAQGTQLLYVLKSNGLGIELRGYGNGTAGAGRIALGTALGTRIAIVGVNRWAVPGAARLVRNDAALVGHDLDQDGLGSELEKKLGTCSALIGTASGPDGAVFDCSRATDPRDTDGDGISDRWEVLGRRDVWPHQPLPLMGSNPRHKDLFVEFDFMQRAPGESEVKMSPATARKFVAYYGDEIGTASLSRQQFRAATLRNPDGKPGIRAHLDIGVAPTEAADATVFGDWGGHNVIPPVQDAQGNWKGVEYSSAWIDHMAPARRGIFRHSPAPASGGGSNSENSFAFSAGINQAWVLAHESGHAQGMGHSGPSGITGVVDPNCKPNYQSMMNYAFQSAENLVGFGDGLETGPLNNAALREWQAVPASNAAYINILQSVFGYYVDPASGHVDWNRDGEFALPGATVRAYANYNPNSTGGCEFTRYNQMNASGTGTTIVSPAIARLAGRTYVFWATPTGIAYKWTSSQLNCPVPDTAPCAAWNGGGTLAIAGAQGLDVVHIGEGPTARLLLVAITPSWHLAETRLRLVGTTETWSPVADPGPGELVRGEPSLAAMNTCEVTLAYKSYLGTLRTRRINCASNWTWLPAQAALRSDGSPLTMNDEASPALARGYVPSKGAANLLLGAFVSPTDNRLRLYAQEAVTGRWELTSDLETMPLAKGRPAIEWAPFGASDYPGRLYLAYRRASDSMYRWMWSYTKVTKDSAGNVLSKQGRIGLDTWFDNVWFGGSGLDFLYESSVDTNLRAVSAAGTGVVQLRPKADGIQNFSYLNYNDWQVHRVGLCRQVVNPGNTVSNPIACPAKDW